MEIDWKEKASAIAEVRGVGREELNDVTPPGEQLHEELEQVRVALYRMASQACGPSRSTPSPGAAPTDYNVHVIVEIEARTATVGGCL
jgi:hypothetical protein